MAEAAKVVDESKIIRVPIKGTKEFIEYNTDELSDPVYKEALLLGMKELQNRKMSKLTKAAFNGDEAKRTAALVAQAHENAEAIKKGDIRFSAGKAKKASGAINTEAMRIARNLVKDEMKRQGIKVSYVDAKDISAAAKALIEADPDILKQAEANLAERKKVPVSQMIDVTKLVKVNPEKLAKAEAEKANKPLSAKQASKPKTKGGKTKTAQATA